jgi:two-component system, NtrC family, nitrogen regulation response regulator GlnG
MARILLVDDEVQIREVLAAVLAEHGHDVLVAASAEEGLERAKHAAPEIALIDLMLPGMNGVDLLKRLKADQPQMACIVMTAFGSIRSAVDAMRAGGDEYLTKPFDNDELLLAIDRVTQLHRLSREVEALRAELDTRYGFTEIIGVCPAMREVFRVMARVAGLDTTVLILGESGTGKELVARGIHRRSRRTQGPFVAVNCSAIPSTLVEAEFFGYERGAFTDAKEAHPGWLEQAHRGTLFLDEVGDLPLDAQAKLLRVLQDSQVTRLGSRKPVKVDVRVLAATNKDLETAVAKGEFRQDLFWRLNVLALRLPALRDRAEDLPLLIDALIERLNEELGIGVHALSADARQLLLAHNWPGNIRELENTLRGAMIMCEGPTLLARDLPPRIRGEVAGRSESSDGRERIPLADAVRRAVERIERSVICAALVEHRGNRSATAHSLGVNRKTLFNKMREYGLTVEGDADTAE